MYKLRIKYTKAKQAIFITHKDELKIIEKAVIRIGGMLYYENGGHAEIEAAVPLFENMESTSEICDILITKPMDTAYITQALNKTLPVGMAVLSAICLPEYTPSISISVYASVYEIIPEFDVIKMTRREEDDLNLWYKENLNNYLMSEVMLVLMKQQDRNERMDIKPYIIDYEILINNGLRITIETNKEYALNPKYIMEGFKEYVQKDIKYNIKRINILYNK